MPKVALRAVESENRDGGRSWEGEKTHFASSIRFPVRGAAFFRTVGVVVQTTPVCLHRGQDDGGG